MGVFGRLGELNLGGFLRGAEYKAPIPEDGLARGSYNREAAADCFAGRPISGEVQFRLNATLSHGGSAAFRITGGSDLHSRRGTSTLGQFTHQWKLGAVAQGAAQKGISDSKLRHLLVHNQAFACNDVVAGDSALSQKVASRKSTPLQPRRTAN